MKTKLTQHLSEDEKKQAQHDFNDAREFRKLMIKVLEREVASGVVSLTVDESFEKPCWSEYTAATIGEMKALRRVISLLSDEK